MNALWRDPVFLRGLTIVSAPSYAVRAGKHCSLSLFSSFATPSQQTALGSGCIVPDPESRQQPTPKLAPLDLARRLVWLFCPNKREPHVVFASHCRRRIASPADPHESKILSSSSRQLFAFACHDAGYWPVLLLTLSPRWKRRGVSSRVEGEPATSSSPHAIESHIPTTAERQRQRRRHAGPVS